MQALHLAAGSGAQDVCKTLLDAKADPNARDKEGSTALHSAAYNGRSKLVRLLVTAGADVNATDKVRVSGARAPSTGFGFDHAVACLRAHL